MLGCLPYPSEVMILPWIRQATKRIYTTLWVITKLAICDNYDVTTLDLLRTKRTKLRLRVAFNPDLIPI